VSTVEDRGHRVVDEFAEVGRLVEVAGDQQAVAEDGEDVGGVFGVRAVVPSQKLDQEISLPAPMLLDGPANRAGRVRVLGGGVDERTAAIARLLGGVGDEIENRQLRAMGNG
jgi:hypothetical protein